MTCKKEIQRFPCTKEDIDGIVDSSCCCGECEKCNVVVAAIVTVVTVAVIVTMTQRVAITVVAIATLSQKEKEIIILRNVLI